ncbi:MAG: prepilin-type N-terminal cleavage/methylation domain-containing protein, partial [Candidatus Sericytochromatia bacterium]
MIKKYKKGLSLVEVLISTVVISVAVAGVVTVQVVNFETTRKIKDKTFATQKAMQILEELRTLVKNEGVIDKLDLKDDKNKPNPILTSENLISTVSSTQDDPRPGYVISGNKFEKEHWKFVRKVKVERREEDERSRTVFVNVYYSDEDGQPIEPPLASLSAILNTSGSPNLPSQVIDAYSLQVDNLPGWWADVQQLAPQMDDALAQLSLLNRGLDFRLHKITRLAYGRDPYYAPFTNDLDIVQNVNINYPYFYPGKVKNTYFNPNRTEYYFPSANMKSDGMRLLFDNTLENTWYKDNDTSKSFNQFAYSAADMYNNGLRYPEEINL